MMKTNRRFRGSVIAALDIGSSKIACFIGRSVGGSKMEVLGVGHQASKGIKAGTITDMAAAEAAVRKAVHAAENMASDVMNGYPLRDVVINVPGIHARSHVFSADIQVMGQEVSQNDVQRALVKAQSEVLSEDYELIHTIPIGYRIDGHEGIREPCGMVGDKLEVGIHLVTGDVGPLQNFATCIERSHLDVEALCVSAYAAGLACLVEDEMDLGCTVIDVGGGVTSFAVFQGRSMIYGGGVSIGGEHVTNDIAKGLTCSMADAERIKTLYGGALATSSDDNEFLEVQRVGEDEQNMHSVPRSLLIGIIQPRLEEIFEQVRAKIEDHELSYTVGRRVVLTGGASQIPGLKDLAQTVLDKQVRLGRPIQVNALPDAVSGPAFATTAGLLTYVTERKQEMPAEIMAQADHGTLWERVKLWWRENW